LYGEKDFTKTLEISTRCGQDADCNPSSAGGILGALLGYNNIPAYWKQGLKEAEPIDFKYTTTSLEDVYRTGYKHALENIRRNGGKADKAGVTIAVQEPVPVRFEKSFEGHYPKAKIDIHKDLKAGSAEYSFDFEGNGFVVKGETAPWQSTSAQVFNAELYLDGKLLETVKLPAAFTTRRYELFWKYGLTPGKHTVRIKLLNPVEGGRFRMSEVLVYTDKPATVQHAANAR
ncbi:MAG: ADP-ribosylglycohydrolase family protein, partial [Cytophagales bacterium]|nr:ADP-ribosylglycohydrolase family protein [Cytophagales bacterium]